MGRSGARITGSSRKLSRVRSASTIGSGRRPLCRRALVFKKLVYEMRFDEASSRFGEFGRFWTGMQFSIAALPDFWPASVRRNCSRSANPHSGSRNAKRHNEERLAPGGLPLSRARPGGCAWCGEALPPRRRTCAATPAATPFGTITGGRNPACGERRDKYRCSRCGHVAPKRPRASDFRPSGL